MPPHRDLATDLWAEISTLRVPSREPSPKPQPRQFPKMASKMFTPGLRALSHASATAARSARSFQTTSRLADAVAAAPLPARKPVGAFRGG